MTEQIGTGSAEGLYEFCDWLVKKGLMTSAAVEPLRSATKQIVSSVDSDVEAANVNVGSTEFDVEAYMDRFEKLSGAKYAPDSLNAYRRRFRRAVELYRQYLTEGAANFKPPAGRVPRKRPVKENGSNGTNNTAQKSKTEERQLNPPPPPPPDLISYPFPLSTGTIAQLNLPPRLGKDDADRMAVFIRALVFEPQRQITEGEVS